MKRRILIIVFLVLGTLCTTGWALPTVDLTTLGSSGPVTGSIGGTALFYQWDLSVDSTGSGVYDPFVRLKAHGNNTSERGYNTSGQEEFDVLDAGGTKFNHALLLSDLPVLNISGTDYREFTLDLNQDNGKGQFLSLDALKIYTSDFDNLTGWSVGFPTPIWDMGDNWVALNGGNALDNGSGKGDILVYIPGTLFTGGQYVYLYSQFGLQNGWQSSDGFEEWGVRTVVIPAPGAILLGSIGVGLVGWLRRRRTL